MTADTHGNFFGKRLVVFGCGYVGREVAMQAVARGMKVTALTRNAVKAEVYQAAGIETIVADLATREWHQRVPGGVDFVLNCVSSGGGGIQAYRRSYVEGMASLLVWAREAGASGIWVYTSSTSVYPQGGGAVVDETAATGGDERAELLLDAEAQLHGDDMSGPRCFILRLAGIYGPGRHHLLNQVRSGEIAGFGEHHLNLVHRDDIVAAIWAAFGAPIGVMSAIFNVADDHAAPKAEIAAWLAARLGLPSPRFTGVPASARKSITPDRIIANAKLKTVLGWRPRYPSFREGYENLLSR